MLLPVYATHAAGTSCTYQPSDAYMTTSSTFCNIWSLMQAQVDALVTVFGVQQSTTETAWPIWTAMLVQRGLLNSSQQA